MTAAVVRNSLAVANRRGGVRKRVLKGGTITYAARQTSVPCVVRDMGGAGAKLIADLAPHLPSRFLLIIELDGLEADCEIVWRKAKEIGVRFVAPPRSASRRRVQALSEMGEPGEAAKPTLRRAVSAAPDEHAVGNGLDAVSPPVPVPAAGQADSAVTSPQAAPSLPIVIAEDDPDDQAFISEAFREVGFKHQVVFVEDGAELLAYLRAEGRYKERALPGLILLDLNMPRMDGRTALVQIKAMREFRRIPVVVFSTSNVERDVETTYDLGIASYIAKPSTAGELIEIAQLLTKYWGMAVRLPQR